MKNKRQPITSLLFFLLFSGVLVWVICRKPDAMIQLKRLFLTDHPGFAAAHFASLIIVFALFVAAWRSCVLFFSGRCSWRAAGFSWLVPNLGKYLPGKVLMLGGRIEALRRYGISRSTGSIALSFEHALMLVAALPFLAGTVLFRGSEHFSSRSLLLYGVVMIPLFLVVLFPSLPIRGANLVLRKLEKPLITAAPSSLERAGVLLLYLLLWALYGISGFFLIQAMFPGSDIDVFQVIPAFPAAWLLGFLAVFVPGGLGVREAALVLALSPSLSTDDALSVAIAARLTWTTVEMSGVLAGWMIGSHVEGNRSE